MFKAYMNLLFKRKEFNYSFLFMTIISLGLFLYDCLVQYGADVGTVLSADKLFIGRNYNNPIYIILQFILPLIIVIPFSDISSFEKNANITPAVLTRTGRRTYFRSQLFVSGISSWFVVFIPFMLNFILGMIAFPLNSINTTTAIVGGIYSDYYGAYLDKILFPEIFSINAYFYNFILLLLLCLFCSLCSMLIYTISYFLKSNRIFLLFLAFIINNFFIIATDTIGFSISPFDYLFSYSIDYVQTEAFILFLFAFMIILIFLLAPKCEKKLCELT